MTVKLQKINSNAKMPTRGSEKAAGYDLYALTQENIYIEPQETKLIHTGFIWEIPDGYAGFIFARSGLATKEGLAPANKVGVIDSDYRGEVMVSIYNQSVETRVITNGERIAQMVIMPILNVELALDTQLSETERGAGGFGSTGKE